MCGFLKKATGKPIEVFNHYGPKSTDCLMTKSRATDAESALTAYPVVSAPAAHPETNIKDAKDNNLRIVLLVFFIWWCFFNRTRTGGLVTS